MPHEVITRPEHPASMVERIEQRKKPSNNFESAKFHHVDGSSPQRVHHTGGHESHGGKQRGAGKAGERGYQDTHKSRSTHTLSEYGPDKRST
jgi:hypothetical protein